MRFNTRDKKPNLYNIAALSTVTVILLTILFYLKETVLLALTAVIYLILVLILLIRAFIQQLEYNPYSYNSIFYSGFALFVFFILLNGIYLLSMVISSPSDYDVVNVLALFLDSAKFYMILSLPFIFIFSLALCISNISLIINEGRSLTNILGIILSFLLVGGNLILFKYDYYVSGSIKEIFIHDLIANTYAAIYLYFECMLIGTVIANAIVVRHEPDYDKDYMIILGCGLKKDGTPLPLLKGRIDRAIEFANKQKEANGKQLKFVTSGGQGEDEVVSESEAMKRYLMEHGIDEKLIIKEDKSTSTYENMAFSKEKIIAEKQDAKIAFSTTSYHVFRSGLFARRVKMKAEGVSAKTKWYFWPNAAVREFVGLLTKHKLKQFLIFIGMIILYLVLTVIRYMYL
ncbi:MAG: YdcF family protein [Erysipelotrichaceae bacterium]|nr:YdcF family protein [Erysipelotrichaceae bacterium]